MLESLLNLNKSVNACVLEAFAIANACNEQGIANLLAERDDMHKKWNWQLRSSLGTL
jgi:DNA-binding ferritin-like protein